MIMKNKVIDFRSDTVTRPCTSMRRVMAEADVGDDVYGDDPTVNRLEDIAAEMMGHESTLFCSSGTQTNLLALMGHCQRGDEYIVGGNAHTYKYEGGGAAVLGSIQPQPITFESDGTIDLTKAKAAIKEDDFHFARTRLLALENTTGGKVLPQSYIAKAKYFAEENNLALHLDGARVANAAVAQNISIADIATQFDSLSVCLSKGLGAPIGSLLCGNKDFIHEARRLRKMLGGGMRQAGVIAAAGIFALENNVQRLQDDHDNAEYFAEKLTALGFSEMQICDVQTNMVFVTLDDRHLLPICNFLKNKNTILVNDPQEKETSQQSRSTVRMVMHKDISRADIDMTLKHFSTYFDQ